MYRTNVIQPSHARAHKHAFWTFLSTAPNYCTSFEHCQGVKNCFRRCHSECVVGCAQTSRLNISPGVCVRNRAGVYQPSGSPPAQVGCEFAGWNWKTGDRRLRFLGASLKFCEAINHHLESILPKIVWLWVLVMNESNGYYGISQVGPQKAFMLHRSNSWL